MSETEKERVLRMVAEGTLRPHEAAQLLAALAEEPEEVKAPPAGKSAANKNTAREKEKQEDTKQTVEVQVQRADGSTRTVNLPPGLVPMFWELAKNEIKESARTAAQETWSGLKTMVRNKTNEVKTNVTERFTSGKTKPEEPPPPDPAEVQQGEARRQILQMVQNGRISADDAGRLIQQLDAHLAYQKAQEKPAAPPAAAKKR